MLKYALLLCCWFLNTVSWGQELVRIATGEYPPFTSKSDPYHNALNQVIVEAFANVDIAVQFDYFPWARVYAEALTQSYDATSYWYQSEKRKRDFFYSDTVIDSITYFFHLKDKPVVWQSVADLSGKSIAVTHGYTYSDDLIDAGEQGKLKLYWNNSDEQGFKMVLAGRVDLFPIEYYPAQYILKHHFTQLEQSQLSFSKHPLTNTTGHLLFPRHKRSSAALMSRFNQGLRMLKTQGRFKKIYQSITPNAKVDQQ